MQERRICQSDIIKYINEELGVPYSSLCIVIDKVRPGNMVEPRISEIKRGKRKGYKELESHEDMFFDTYFTIKDEELGFQRVREFIEREKLVFPDYKGLKEDDYKSYSLRMLKYGLENCELPSSHKNIVVYEYQKLLRPSLIQVVQTVKIYTYMIIIRLIYLQHRFGSLRSSQTEHFL